MCDSSSKHFLTIVYVYTSFCPQSGYSLIMCVFLQVAAVCDFFMHISHIQKGIIKADSESVLLLFCAYVYLGKPENYAKHKV